MIKSAYLTNLRAKPESVRRRIAVLTSALLTALVVLIWLINLSVTAGSPALGEPTRTLSLFDHFERVRTGFSVLLQSLRSYLP